MASLPLYTTVKNQAEATHAQLYPDIERRPQ